MRDAKLLMVMIPVAIALLGCNNGDMTLPVDNTLPKASEYVLDKTTEEAQAWLLKQGFTYAGEDGDGEVKVFERGERDTLFDNGGGGVEERLRLLTDEGTVLVAYGSRNFHNIQDALKVYRRWSKYIWREILPDPLIWHGFIVLPNGELLPVSGDYDPQAYIDGTLEREEDKRGNRKQFESNLEKVTDFDELFEMYMREDPPKEINLSIKKCKGFLTVQFSNGNMEDWN